MPSPLARSAGFLAIALTLALSGCSGDFGPSSADESSGAGSSASRSTASSSSADSSSADSSGTTASAPPVSPIDVCTLVSAANVGDVLSTTVAGTPTDAGCTYTYTDGSTGPVIRAQTDTGGVLDTSRAASEASLGGVAEVVDLAGNPGYIVIGSEGGTVGGEGAVAVHGLIVSVGLTGGDAEGNHALIQGLLELLVDVL